MRVDDATGERNQRSGTNLPEKASQDHQVHLTPGEQPLHRSVTVGRSVQLLVEHDALHSQSPSQLHHRRVLPAGDQQNYIGHHLAAAAGTNEHLESGALSRSEHRDTEY